MGLQEMAMKPIINKAKKMFKDKMIPTLIDVKTKYMQDAKDYEKDVVIIITEKNGFLFYIVAYVDEQLVPTRVIKNGPIDQLINQDLTNLNFDEDAK